MIILSFQSFAMVTFRLTQSADKKNPEYKWTLENADAPEEIQIVTWKGTYKIDNVKPTHEYGEDFRVDQGQYQIGYSHCVPRYFWVINQKWGLTLVRTWHPLRKEWRGNGYYVTEKIIEELVEWILSQPPQEDQLKAAYEEDRLSVEKTFVEIENVKK